jgi:hypothetical protein
MNLKLKLHNRSVQDRIAAKGKLSMRARIEFASRLIGLLLIALTLGSLSPVNARLVLPLDFTPIAYVYLPFVESNVSTANDTPTPTPTMTPTPTATPTSHPGPPMLIAPSSGAVLTQPVGLNEWLFHWDARTGPCFSSFNTNGPNGYSIGALVSYQTSSPGPYSYHYTRTVPFPADAFGAWTWQAIVSCPLGSAQSEIRTFYFGIDTPTPTPTVTPTATPTYCSDCER